MPDVTVTIAGEAGQGIRLAGQTLTRLFARDGYHVFAWPDVMSRIRGGHNLTQIRVSDRPVQCVGPDVNLLLALDEFSAGAHLDEIVADGVVVAEGDGEVETHGRAQVVRVPFVRLAEEQGGAKVYSSAVALGAMVALVGQPLDSLGALLRASFEHKGDEVVGANLRCAKAGFDAVEARYHRQCPCRVPRLGGRPKLLLTGNEAVGYGTLCAGVRVYSGYPMSPATGVMEYLAGRQAGFDLVVEQAEDEIAAINIALGASWAGARAMTATSGGGFALMVEALGLAGIAELPVVVVIAQRPGPATGFPTRHEQAELLYALNASQDEFPRFVLAPAGAEEAAYATCRAFELAGRFQVPAIVLSDQQLADSSWTLDEFDRDRLQASDDFAHDPAAGVEPRAFRRYELTVSGVSPRIRPGRPGQFVRSMGSEHDEAGFATENAANRRRMHAKRLRKAAAMAREFGAVEAFPSEPARVLVACFGSTRGAVREAVAALRQDGVEVAMLFLPELWPFPAAEVEARLANCRRLVTVEQNSTGQLGRLFTRMTRRRPDAEILKYDGRPFSGAALVERIGEVAG
ncbi:MAG: 2-oxoacid:acceptor oxidoreductase subunit alpha [bacterium]